MTDMTKSKPNYKRGDILLVLFPNSDLRTAKLRPALVVQAENLKTGLPQVIVAMISSNLKRANHPSRVTVKLSSSEGEKSGLLGDSVIMTDNLATIDERSLFRNIGKFPMQEVDNALRKTLSL